MWFGNRRNRFLCIRLVAAAFSSACFGCEVWLSNLFFLWAVREPHLTQCVIGPRNDTCQQICDRQTQIDHATEKGVQLDGIACVARAIPPNNNSNNYTLLAMILLETREFFTAHSAHLSTNWLIKFELADRPPGDISARCCVTSREIAVVVLLGCVSIYRRGLVDTRRQLSC